MIKIFSILICLIAMSEIASAESTNQTMIKIVVRNISTNNLSNSFAAQPVTHYRSGENYGRTEEAIDSAMGIHGLIIISEPDAWMINLIPKTGVHMVDGGPTYVFHDSILSPQGKSDTEFRAFKSSSISKFEFGKELEFLVAHKAKKLSDHYELIIDGYKIDMFTKGETEIPYQLKISKNGSQISYLQYDEYKMDLPFDSSLFSLPSDIKISERN